MATRLLPAREKKSLEPGAQKLTNSTAQTFRRDIAEKVTRSRTIVSATILIFALLVVFQFGAVDLNIEWIGLTVLLLGFLFPLGLWVVHSRTDFLCPESNKYLEPLADWICPTCDTTNTSKGIKYGRGRWLTHLYFYHLEGTRYSYFYECVKCRIAPDAFLSPHTFKPIDLGLGSRYEDWKIAIRPEERGAKQILLSSSTDLEELKKKFAERVEDALKSVSDPFQRNLSLDREVRAIKSELLEAIDEDVIDPGGEIRISGRQSRDLAQWLVKYASDLKNKD